MGIGNRRAITAFAALLLAQSAIWAPSMADTAIKDVPLPDASSIHLETKYGYIDRSGKFVIPPKYAEALDFAEGIAFVKKNSEQTEREAIDTSGAVKFKLEVTCINETYKQGLMTVQSGEKMSFVDKSGHFYLPDRFTHIGDRHDGLIEVNAADGKGGWVDQVVDSEGQVLYDTRKPADTFTKSGFHVFKFGDVAFYTSKGDPRPAGWFKDGLAIASSPPSRVESGYIDLSGEFVIPPKYVGARDFSEGLAHVVILGQPNRHAFLDKSGKVVFSLNEKVTAVDDFHEGRAAFKIESAGIGTNFAPVPKVGFIDREGKAVVAANYDTVNDLPFFSEGLALVRREDQYGYLDKQGKVAIPFSSDYSKEFHDGLAVKVAHIDAAGVAVNLSDPKYGYQTIELYSAAIQDVLEKSLGELNPEKHIRFRFAFPYEGRASQIKIIHSSGSSSIDKEVEASVTAMSLPKPGENINSGRELEFVLWNHKIYIGHTPGDPFYKQLLRRQELTTSYDKSQAEHLQKCEELVSLDKLLLDEPDTLERDSWQLLLCYRDADDWKSYEKVAREIYDRDHLRGFSPLQEGLAKLNRMDDLSALVKSEELERKQTDVTREQIARLDNQVALGDTYLEKKDYAKAEDCYRRCYDGSVDRFEPGTAWETFLKARWRLVFFHLMRDQLNLARADFGTIVQRASAANQGYSVLGTMFLQNYLAAIYKLSPTAFEEDAAKANLLYSAEAREKWGFIDKAGKIVVPGRFSKAGQFAEGLANVSIKGLWGFVDKQANWKIGPQYFAAKEFSEGLACVSESCLQQFPTKEYSNNQLQDSINPDDMNLSYITDTKCGFIDAEGRQILAAKYGLLTAFHNGLAATIIPSQSPSAIGVIDRSGNFVIQPRYFAVGKFHNNMAVAREKDGSAGYNGGGCIGYLFQKFHSLNLSYGGGSDDAALGSGLNPKPASEEYSSLYGYADSTGKFVIAPSFDRAERFAQGLAPVQKNGLWGFIDPSGKLLIDYKYESAEPFEDDVSRAKISGKVGLIDKLGNWVSEPKYGSISEFEEGFAIVSDSDPTRRSPDDRFGFIDDKGRPLGTMTYEAVHPFHDGLAAVKSNGHWGFINRFGKYAIEPIYLDANNFANGLVAVRFPNN